MGSRRVGHDWATSLSLFTFMHWRRTWQPTQCSCLENPRVEGARWAAVCGVAQSRTRLKRLSSSSSWKDIRLFPVSPIFLMIHYVQNILCTAMQLLFPVAQTVKNLPVMQETRVRSMDWEVPMEKRMAIHSNILAWRIPWTEKHGGLQSVGWQRVGHD